jgi:hypothetical protein
MEVIEIAKYNSLDFGYLYLIPPLINGVIDNDALLLALQDAKDDILSAR